MPHGCKGFEYSTYNKNIDVTAYRYGKYEIYMPPPGLGKSYSTRVTNRVLYMLITVLAFSAAASKSE